MEKYADFEPFLESVKESGNRTRSVIYINIVLIAIRITMLRNYTYPTWDIAHFREATKISKCISQVLSNRSVIEREACDQELRQRFNVSLDEIAELNRPMLKDPIRDEKAKGEIEKAAKTLDELDQIDPKNSLSYDQAKSLINNLVQTAKIENIDPFTKLALKFYANEIDEKVKREYFDIAFFGISLHQNDSWMVTGVFNAVALVILRAFMKRELENIRMAGMKSVDNPLLGYLILSTQVFATPEMEYGLNWIVRNVAFIALYFLPFAIHAWIVIDDISPENVGVVYRLLDYNVAAAIFEYLCEVGTLFFLGFAGWRCYKIQFNINREIVEINKNIKYVEDRDKPAQREE